MPSSTSNPTRHRARIVAEAVVSAYIHEIAQPSPPRGRGDVHTDLATGPGAIVASPSYPRSLGRARGAELARRRRKALELVA